MLHAVGNDGTVAVYLEVALVGVHDDVEVLVAAEDLRDDVAEAFLEHAHESRSVDILRFLEFFEGIEHAYCFFFFLQCCHSLFETY